MGDKRSLVVEDRDYSRVMDKHLQAAVEVAVDKVESPRSYSSTNAFILLLLFY